MQTFGRYPTSFNTVKSFSFQRGEVFKELSLWENYHGTHLGKIEFTTNRGNSFVHRMTNYKYYHDQESSIDVGSGLCVGVVGRHGHDVDKLGFIFVKPIKSSVMDNVKYPTLDIVGTNVQVCA